MFVVAFQLKNTQKIDRTFPSNGVGAGYIKKREKPL